MRKDGGVAFPTAEVDGMSLRDYFAGQALAGLLPTDWLERFDEDWMARSAYSIADAMLAEREK